MSRAHMRSRSNTNFWVPLVLLALVGFAGAHYYEDEPSSDDPITEQIARGMKDIYQLFEGGGSCSERKSRNRGKGGFKKLVKSISHKANRIGKHILSEARDTVAKGKSVLDELNRQAKNHAATVQTGNSKEYYVPRLKRLILKAGASYSGLLEKHELVGKLCELTPECKAAQEEEARSGQMEVVSKVLHKLHTKVMKVEQWLSAEQKARAEQQEGILKKVRQLEAEMRDQRDAGLGISQCLALKDGAWCASTKICRLPQQTKWFSSHMGQLVDTNLLSDGPCWDGAGWVTRNDSGRVEEGRNLLGWALILCLSQSLIAVVLWCRPKAAAEAPSNEVSGPAQIPVAEHCAPNDPADNEVDSMPPLEKSVSQEESSNATEQDPEDRSKLEQLQRMGFSGADTLQQALNKANGDVSAAALALSLACAPPAYAPEEGASEEAVSELVDDTWSAEIETWDEMLDELVQMGFPDAEKNGKALSEADGNITLALKALIAEERSSR
eukprot:TRINITY_DN2265_c0_g1_i1.p1 TRINITY_DN2265_c0_g1~~TRINITY_DN2265_c0_g1_i1.p1  ORF type:complete len:498 (-),score=122.23 TRINITY_DN2265_c0_g1_i1:243-1736(-)